MKAIIGISCNYKADDVRSHHLTGDKYVRAVLEAAGAVPVLIPALGAAMDTDGLLAGLDGVLLTGGASNVEPQHYGGHPPRDESLIDGQRDQVILPLVRRAVASGVPVFGVCRGHQEINVAFGGSLHQHLHEVDGREDHRMERDRPLDERFRPRHQIRIRNGSLLRTLNGGAEEAFVNTLHGQAIDRLGDGLQVDATAQDSTIEAISVKDAAAFAIGVQWHAEWRPSDQPLHAALFKAFGEAASRRAGARRT